jgi:antitoxin component HigA of HigAB toxin-antitoxin module
MDIEPIKTQRDYRRVLKETEGLMVAKHNTAEGDRLDVLVTLVEAWERKQVPLDLPDPVETMNTGIRADISTECYLRGRSLCDLSDSDLLSSRPFSAGGDVDLCFASEMRSHRFVAAGCLHRGFVLGAAFAATGDRVAT